ADAVFALAVVLQSAVPVAVTHVYRPGFDAMAAGVLQDLIGAVEAHGPAVDQGAGEGGRFVAFEPAAGVGKQGEAGGVGFGEAVVAEALDLLEDALGKFLCIAALEHALGEFLPVRLQPALAFPGGHGAAQLVCFPGAVASSDDGNFHDLLLKQGDAEGTLEDLFQLWRRVVDRLLSVPPAQVGVDHVALYRAGADDGDFDDQIVELPGAQARQHAHLRPGFDLEYAYGVSLAD